MIIIGYRPNFTHYCGRGCNCVEGGMDSALSIDSAASASQAADLIASRLWEAKGADHLFLVARDGVPVNAFREYSVDLSTEEHSVKVVRDFSLEGGIDLQGDALEEEIRTLLSSKRSALEKKEKEEAEAKHLKYEEDRKKHTEQQELAKLAQLKAKYEPVNSDLNDPYTDGPEPK